MITPNDSITLVPRQRHREDRRQIPILLLVGNADGKWPPGVGRVVTFDKSLVIGRRTTTNAEAGVSSLVLSDRMISGRHASITRVGEGYEITDLESTNGTIVDGVAARSTVKLHEGSLVFVGGYAAVFRVVSVNELAAIMADLERPLGPVATASPALAVLCGKLRKLAEAGEEILLTGETGVGKEVYANAIHRASARKGKFVAINCAAIPRELVESELFGYVRGAHSQAAASKPGIIEEAEGGTLFLDEIGEMAPELQTKLLRFTQDRMLAPVGGVRLRAIDTRIIAATSRTTAPGKAGNLGLRVDLAARLGAEPIRIPPLRERVEDIGVLVSHLLAERGKPFELAAFQALCLHPWPGNVRELGKVVTSAEALARGADRVTSEHLPAAIAAAPGRVRSSPGRRASRPPPKAVELEELMRRFNGNMLRVARELDRKPALVYRWAKRFRLNADDFRPKDE
ncbi:MAG TPA: sigma 54-interacting transcriptional regulator [Polyangia bacterium]|nr:sigma 54-interacting transcriptional regulator [Polyangia bacterium]